MMTRQWHPALEEALRDKHVGWFVQATTESFGFLVNELGYRLEEVYLHFQGTFVSYRAGRREVVIEYQPDARNVMCHVRFRSDGVAGGGRSVAISDLLASRDPLTEWSAPPRNRGLDQKQVVYLVASWAKGLRRLAPDVLQNGE